MRRAHLLPGLAASLGIYVLHAYLKYGVPYDMGLHLWYAVDTAGGLAHPQWGPFNIHYLPLGLYTALFMAPMYVPHFPWIGPQQMGQALIFTSPALFCLLGMKFNRKNLLLSAAVILSMSGCLCVWSNGVEQFGARYWIQALPFLMAMLATSEVREGCSVVFRRATLVSVFLVVWGMASIRLLGWMGQS
jgi:hypothetical protein